MIIDFFVWWFREPNVPIICYSIGIAIFIWNIAIAFLTGRGDIETKNDDHIFFHLICSMFITFSILILPVTILAAIFLGIFFLFFVLGKKSKNVKIKIGNNEQEKESQG